MGHSMTKNQLIMSSLVGVLIILPLYIFNSSSFSWLPSHGKKCDIFEGNWVRCLSNRPYYTNATCGEIIDQQNCMKFGRSDTDFLKWKWKPKECELPSFDAEQFLELVRGKSMAFVGDSLGRNQLQSLLCLLANVVKPANVVAYTTDPVLKRWVYLNYNFTLALFWSPHLVKAIDADPNAPVYDRFMDVYLDVPSDAWAAQIEGFDYVIFSAGRWFYGRQVFHENGRVVGCYGCERNNTKKLTMFYGYRRVFRTVFKTLVGLKGFKGVAFLRTLSPAHFENGEWNKGGNCNRTQPVPKGQQLHWHANDLELYKTQVGEFRRAEMEGKKKGLKFKLLDISEVMVMRPDGHPNHFGHWPNENVAIADCVHWCLPGPIDTWNEFFLQMLKMDKQS